MMATNTSAIGGTDGQQKFQTHTNRTQIHHILLNCFNYVFVKIYYNTSHSIKPSLNGKSTLCTLVSFFIIVFNFIIFII